MMNVDDAKLLRAFADRLTDTQILKSLSICEEIWWGEKFEAVLTKIHGF